MGKPFALLCFGHTRAAFDACSFSPRGNHHQYIYIYIRKARWFELGENFVCVGLSQGLENDPLEKRRGKRE